MTAVEQRMSFSDADSAGDGGDSYEAPPRHSGPRIRQAVDRRGQEVTRDAVVVVSPGELQTIVRDAVRAELGERTDGDILTRDEAAEMVKVHPKILLKYVRTLGLPAQRLGRDWRFSRRDVLTWMRDRPTMKAVK
jgi:excisionase family DNA binding protein